MSERKLDYENMDLDELIDENNRLMLKYPPHEETPEEKERFVKELNKYREAHKEETARIMKEYAENKFNKKC
ncbi:hypothetical protein [Companilactobacillus ginsenosidimutans]|uniref:Uncharacterized protein n=1 Tax=Companilactobacillus ginsenosidimutans TaxID=1007676 RepID=A0A0H4R1B3_9LACO|nr:hypothetical protein [Companilactobacillus ginsenosidimutans]AKP67500.1 hypothetical protein ABM34_08140 [Companilactobacillus ginsenosidimutans]